MSNTYRPLCLKYASKWYFSTAFESRWIFSPHTKTRTTSKTHLILELSIECYILSHIIVVSCHITAKAYDTLSWNPLWPAEKNMMTTCFMCIHFFPSFFRVSDFYAQTFSGTCFVCTNLKAWSLADFWKPSKHSKKCVSVLGEKINHAHISITTCRRACIRRVVKSTHTDGCWPFIQPRSEHIPTRFNFLLVVHVTLNRLALVVARMDDDSSIFYKVQTWNWQPTPRIG